MDGHGNHSGLSLSSGFVLGDDGSPMWLRDRFEVKIIGYEGYKHLDTLKSFLTALPKLERAIDNQFPIHISRFIWLIL